MSQCPFQSSIENTGGNAPVVLLKDFLDRWNDPGQALAAERREGEDRCIRKETETLPDFLQKAHRLLPVLFHGVPLVDSDDTGSIALLDVSGNMKVLIRDTLDSIDHHNAHMASVYALKRPDDTDLFQSLPGPALAPDTGGVDQHVSLPLQLELRIDRITSRTGTRADDDPLLPQQTVDKR